MKTTYLESKPRYEILDGLRGVAAVIVVAFHLFETYSGGHITQIINHGYLAVDFFFVLSGFVIGYAYDDRWGKMSTWDFFKRRLVRLHPMVIMGTIIGGLLFYFGACGAFPSIGQTPVWMLLVTMLGCFFMIPFPASFDIRGWNEMNPLNGPNWTLTWEYLANILYAFIIRRFTLPVLSVFVALAACLTILLTNNIDIFGLLAARDYASYTVIGGWSLTPDQLYVGISRLLYPFFAGLLLYRIGRRINIRGAFGWCSLFIIILLAMPFIGSESCKWTNGIYESICILILFPIIVAIGAGSSIKGKKTIAACKFLGEISYPIYITHYPLIYIQMAWADNNPDTPTEMHIFVAVSLFILSIAIAYATLKLYDLPIRERLKNKFLLKK